MLLSSSDELSGNVDNTHCSGHFACPREGGGGAMTDRSFSGFTHHPEAMCWVSIQEALERDRHGKSMPLTDVERDFK